MHLILGSAYQGKLRYLRETLNVPEKEIVYCDENSSELNLDGRAVTGLHLWVKAVLKEGGSPETELAQKLDRLAGMILLCDELGGGIVPLTREDRRWRESTGKVLQLLAAHAQEVTEVLAGIPRRLR